MPELPRSHPPTTVFSRHELVRAKALQKLFGSSAPKGAKGSTSEPAGSRGGLGCEAGTTLGLWLEFAGANAEYRLTGNRSFLSDLGLVRTIENEERSLAAFCAHLRLDVAPFLAELVRLKARKTAGSEHVVYLSRSEGRVYKVTHPAKYGKTRSTPSEYLRRLALMNLLIPTLGIDFEDFVSVDNGGNSVVTSMNYFSGRHPTSQQIARYLMDLGFKTFSDRSGTIDYLHSASGIVFRDCHQANWVISQSTLVPIDVIPEFASIEIRPTPSASA